MRAVGFDSWMFQVYTLTNSQKNENPAVAGGISWYQFYQRMVRIALMESSIARTLTSARRLFCTRFQLPSISGRQCLL